MWFLLLCIKKGFSQLRYQKKWRCWGILWLLKINSSTKWGPDNQIQYDHQNVPAQIYYLRLYLGEMYKGATNYFGFFFSNYNKWTLHSPLSSSPLALSLTLWSVNVFLFWVWPFFRTSCEFFILSHRHMTVGEEGMCIS